MSDFIAFTDDITYGTEYLEHFGILGQKHGQRNGPPYPLGSGDHSSAEKSAAKAAGVSVGSDSGKGSIDNVKKKKSGGVSKSAKKELTPEEKREIALKAAASGDRKKIAKNMDQLTTDELRDATDRARYKNELTRENTQDKKMSKADVDKMDAIRSGDKEKVRAFADKMSYQELKEAMDKIDLTVKLNKEPPPKTAMDKMDDIMNTVDKVRGWAEKGINAYNVVAKVYNSTNPDSKWPEIKSGGNKDKDGKEKSEEKKATEKVVKDIGKDIEKTYKEKAAERLENDKIDYKRQKDFDKWKEKQEAKEAKKEEKKAEKEAKKAEKEAAKEAKKQYVKDWDDDIWSSVEDATRNSAPISDDLTPEEEAFWRSFVEDKD